MDLNILTAIGLSLLMGLPLFFVRLKILKNEKDTRYIYIQLAILLVYVVSIALLQYIDTINSNIYLTVYIVYIWIGYYFLIEPLVVFITIFYHRIDINIAFLKYFMLSTVFTFIWTTIVVALLITYIVSSGALAV